MLEINHAESPEDIAAARELFLEYAKSLDFKPCFQSFDEELATLPGRYADPDGRLLVARIKGELAGCVALRKLGEGICEMKRLYVRPAWRGNAVGWALVLSLLDEAPRMGYRSMRLNSVQGKMDSAISIYRAVGFQTTAPYDEHPVDGTIYMERDLTAGFSFASATAVRNALKRLVKLNE